MAAADSGYGQTASSLSLEELEAKITRKLESVPSPALEVDVREVAREGTGPPLPPTLLRVSMARGGKFLVRAYRNDVELCGLACDGATVTEWDSGTRKWTRYAAPDLDSELARLEPPEGFTFVDPASLERPGLALVGKPVPDWKLTTLDGEPIALVPKGDERCVLILAWATWCNPCRVEKEALARLAADGELKGVRVIAVSVDGKLATVRAHLKKHPLPFTVAWDPEFGEKVGTQHVPITLLIDAKGVVRDGWTGFGEGEGPIQKLKAAIDACRE